tara:strand:+ start:1725 stop:2309 length:585 start_codon:yes stop_codon:yes gene_type:complete
MIIFPTGIVLTANENSSLLHMVPDAEAWVTSTITEKATTRRNALIEEWRPTLYADASVTELPADSDDLATLILARSDYKTRAQQDAAADPVEPTSTVNKDNYDAVTRSGSTVTLFSSGITITDLLGNCILSSIQNLEEWVYGAVLGMVNRGKKKMISQYHPIIMDDASVTTMPATEDGLITMILARSDYQRLGG